MKHSGNEAAFKANEAALAAYERAISKPPPSAAGWRVLDWICVRVSRQGGKNASLLLWLLDLKSTLQRLQIPAHSEDVLHYKGKYFAVSGENQLPLAKFLKVLMLIVPLTHSTVHWCTGGFLQQKETESR